MMNWTLLNKQHYFLQSGGPGGSVGRSLGWEILIASSFISVILFVALTEKKQHTMTAADLITI